MFKILNEVINNPITVNNIEPFFNTYTQRFVLAFGLTFLAITLYLLAWYIYKILGKTPHKGLLSLFVFPMILSFVLFFLGSAVLTRAIWEFQQGIPNYYIPLKLSFAFIAPGLALFIMAIVFYVLYKKKL